jgi:hypothetical protein
VFTAECFAERDFCRARTLFARRQNKLCRDDATVDQVGCDSLIR